MSSRRDRDKESARERDDQKRPPRREDEDSMIGIPGAECHRWQLVLVLVLILPLPLLHRAGVFEEAGLSLGQLVALQAPLVMAACALAFLKWRGRYLFWVLGPDERGEDHE